MASTKATGIDGLSVKLLKLTFNHVGGILHFIFNQSISSRVVPLYKAGDENLVNNYRPVSILPIVSKIIERHVFNSFYEYLSTNNLITDSQSGFRPSHSCETALNGLTDNGLRTWTMENLQEFRLLIYVRHLIQSTIQFFYTSFCLMEFVTILLNGFNLTFQIVSNVLVGEVRCLRKRMYQ